MKKLKHIVLLTAAATAAIFLYSCGAANKEEMAEAPAENKAMADSTEAPAMNSEDALFADSLTEEQKEIFGKRAVQKLEDFNGYIAIMAGHFDSTVHNQAKILAAELFDGKLNPDSLMQHTFQIEIRDIFVSKNAEAINDSLYRGELTYENKVAGEGRRDRMNFVIKKINKRFGTEQQVVWEVYLSPHP